VLDRPGGYKAHERPVPLLGGLAVLGAAALAVAPRLAGAGGPGRGGLVALGAGTLVVALAGLRDDVAGLSARHKLAWQVAAAGFAGLLLAFQGVRLDLFIEGPRVPMAILTALWVVGITNAFNFLDNMDGLCPGLGAVAAASLCVANLRAGDPEVALAAAALAGACLGFLPWNWPRARVFLGDTGSMAIGFALAGLSVMGIYARGSRVPGLAILVPVLILAVPILDLVLVLALRLRARHPVWRGDRRHMSHRLVRRGLRPPLAVAVLWGVAAACGGAALLLPRLDVVAGALLLAGLVAGLGLLAAAAGARGLP
jgi:UDP-GlcNAc:undecaprenyl-phosphate GlcNAc-1-phosphate transferase